jgi:hypothetical protein
MVLLCGPFARFSLRPKSLGDFLVVLSEAKVFSFLSSEDFSVVKKVSF